MYPAGSGDGTSEMFDETPAVPLVTVAKRYRKQTSQTGSDDFVCIAEQSGLEDVQASPESGPAVASGNEPSDLVLGPLLPPPSFTAVQSDSQVFATPAPAGSPLQILVGEGDLALEAGDAHIQVSPTKPGSTSSPDFLSATEPFSVILDDEPPLQLHSLQHSAAAPMDAAFGTSGVKTGRTALQDTLAQTVSSMPSKRTAWDLGCSSFRAVSKARHGMLSLLSSCALPPKPVHVLRNTASAPVCLPRMRPVPSKRGYYAAYPSLQNVCMDSGLVAKVASPAGGSRLSSTLPGPVHKQSSFISSSGGPSLGSILEHSTSKAATVCTSAQVHAKNWIKALRLWKDLCISLKDASSCLPDIFSSSNCDKLLEKLLCKVSDTTALRYIASAVKMVSALQDLGFPLDAPSQVQLIDSWMAAQKESGKDNSLHSENALKALRWLKQTAALVHWPDLYQALFATGAWKQSSPRKESVPLPLAFVVWLETRILMDAFDVATTVFAGTVLLCIWGSLRFSDVQHVIWRDSILDDTSFRAASYRTKTSRFMPFGIHCGGFYQRSASQSWVMRWLQAFECISSKDLQSDSPPDFGFMRVAAEDISPLSYCSTLAALRSLLSSWGGISEEQVFLYTLHSMKATFLSFYRQCGCSQEVRHLQGHHKFQQSMHLYGRDDISPCIAEHRIFVDKVRGGWRPRTPLMRGVHFILNEPSVAFADASSFWSLSVDLHFFKLHLTEDSVALPSQVIPATVPSQNESVDDEGIFESDSSGSEPEQPDEVDLCMAETSSIAHALVKGKPACGCRGCFRAVDGLPPGARLCKHKSYLAIFSILQ